MLLPGPRKDRPSSKNLLGEAPGSGFPLDTYLCVTVSWSRWAVLIRIIFTISNCAWEKLTFYCYQVSREAEEKVNLKPDLSTKRMGFIILCVCGVLGIKSRALCMPGKCSASELHPHIIFKHLYSPVLLGPTHRIKACDYTDCAKRRPTKEASDN